MVASASSKVVKLETDRTASGQTLFTVSRLSREFRLDRRTVTKRLEGIPASGTDRRGYEGWTLDVASPALLQIGEDVPAVDAPTRPFDRDKFYAAELKRLQLERELGEVAQISEVRSKWSEIVKQWVAWIQSLPDQLERAAGLSPQQVQQLEQRIDEMRGDLHAELVGEDADDDD